MVLPPVSFSPINVPPDLNGGVCPDGGADGPEHLARDPTYSWANAYKNLIEQQWTVMTEIVGKNQN